MPTELQTVGARAWYRHSLKGSKPPYQGSSVPCGTCTACCTNVRVVLYPQLGDRPETYGLDETETEPVLTRRTDGSCLYLHDGTCLIYDRRPFACRQFDCRALLVADLPRPLHVYQAASQRFRIAEKEPLDHDWLADVRTTARILEAQGQRPDAILREALAVTVG